MKSNRSIRKEIKVVAALIALFTLIAFAERHRGLVVCSNIVVKMKNVHENHFMNEAEAIRMVEAGERKIRGVTFGEINLREIESKLRFNKHVKDAQLYGDMKGNLVVSIELRRPVARIVQEDGPDAYLSGDGMIMPVSEKFTSRVLIISGSFVSGLLKKESINDLERGPQVMELVGYITHDDFWKAQVAQLDINEKGRIILYPQVTHQVVEFGLPENIEVKMKKLKVFYKEILPQMGWNKYKRVNLEFEGQVVAE